MQPSEGSSHARPLRTYATAACLAACAVACGPKAEPASPSGSKRFVPPADVLPSAHALTGAPECVQAMAATRQCFVDHMTGAKTTGHGQFSCPHADSWGRGDLDLDARTAGLPYSMEFAWNKALNCVFQFREPLTDAQQTELETANVRLDSGRGKIEELAFGTIPLSHLFCLSDLEFVKQLECEQPAPVLSAR